MIAAPIDRKQFPSPAVQLECSKLILRRKWQFIHRGLRRCLHLSQCVKLLSRLTLITQDLRDLARMVCLAVVYANEQEAIGIFVSPNDNIHDP